jgi:hypothetical protein
MYCNKFRQCHAEATHPQQKNDIMPCKAIDGGPYGRQELWPSSTSSPSDTTGVQGVASGARGCLCQRMLLRQKLQLLAPAAGCVCLSPC